MLEPFLADCKKADSRVENLPVLVRLTEVLNPFIELEQGTRKDFCLFCGSLVGCFFFFSLLAFHRTESHAKLSGKWPYCSLKVCPKLGPCLRWGWRGASWLFIKKEVNLPMRRGQVADFGRVGESGWTWGSSGVLFSWANVSQLRAVAVVSRCCQPVKKRRRCLLRMKTHLRNNKYQNKLFWRCLGRGKTEGHPSRLVLDY